MRLSATRAQNVALSAFIGLIALTLAWEGWLAPDPNAPPGLWLIVKALPLLVPLFGLLHGKRYTYAWTSMLVIAYFVEGLVVMTTHRRDAWSAHGPLPYAVVEVALTVLFVVGAVLYLKAGKRSNARVD